MGPRPMPSTPPGVAPPRAIVRLVKARLVDYQKDDYTPEEAVLLVNHEVLGDTYPDLRVRLVDGKFKIVRRAV